MKFSIVVSLQDVAGMNIRKQLLKENFAKHSVFHGNDTYSKVTKSGEIWLYTIPDETVNADYIDDEIETDILIFATRHQSKSGEKTLSVHVPGNFGIAGLGGREKSLCMANPSMMKTAFKSLNEKGSAIGFDITLEVTHHGPLLRKPTFFIEIGSSMAEWQNEEAAGIIKEVILSTIKDGPQNGYPVAIGFGGSHYCSAFNRLERDTDIALSHICPKYAMQHIDASMVRQMIEKSGDKNCMALLDWNGLAGADKAKLKTIFSEQGIIYKKTSDI